MRFPENFKSFEECEEFFSSKNAGIFHGDDQVVIRILSDNDRKEEKCVYSVQSDSSLKKESDSNTKHKDAEKSRTSETSEGDDDGPVVEKVQQKTVVDPKPSSEKKTSEPEQGKSNNPKKNNR